MLLIFAHIICYDIWFYLLHILLHNPNIYFLHKTHHRTRYNHLTFKDSKKGHVIEHIIEPLGVFVPYLFCGVSLTQVGISFVIITIRGYMRHDYRCCWIIGNHHLLHHKYPKYNFGEYWIDTVIGTVCPHKKEYIYGAIYT
jgi:sterol desaturase/sphingolipid hydroxylase (fatty acid hydroxylase superfamily)